MEYTSRIESPPGFPGMQGSLRVPGGIITLINGASEVAQVNTVSIGTVAPGTVYTISIDNQSITYTAGASDTAATVLAELVESVNLSGVGVRAQSTTATAFTITGYPGKAFNITGTGGTGFSVATTTPSASSSPIKFGRAVVQLPTDELRLGRLPSAKGQKFKGVTLASQKQQTYGGESYYRHTEPMPVVKMGSVWVPIEAPGSEVFVRFFPSGGLTEIGGFSGVAGSGLAKLVGAEWLYFSEGIAELSLTGEEALEPDNP
jgi:hypothetical protein